MRRFLYIIYLALLVLVIQSCGTARRFGTTVIRDENNKCLVNIIIQVAVKGTVADLADVRTKLEACYNNMECFIPCDKDSLRGCKVKTSVDVKLYDSLKEYERVGYHVITMVDDDGQPSNARIGRPNSGASSGTWRRSNDPGQVRTYCHEVLHLCGLEDQYCDRRYDPVTGTITVRRNCETPPDPDGGNCCTPTADWRRCTVSCTGHEHDLMANLESDLSCQNIMAIVKKAGSDKCPEECCNSEDAFVRPGTEFYLIPGYLHFGDNNQKFGSFGASVGYTKYLNSSFGLGIEGGYYLHSEKDNSYKQTYGLLNITAGINYKFLSKQSTDSKIELVAHAMAGISRYSQKTTFGSNSNSTSEISFHLNLGASINYKLNDWWTVRILQADYGPTFFYDATQHNFRISAGIVRKLKK